MKLLINEEGLGKNLVDERRQGSRFVDRYGARNPYSDIVRGPRRKFYDTTIVQLIDLSFSRRRAIEALNRNQGNIELSVEYLLGQPPDALEEEDEKEMPEQRDANIKDEEIKTSKNERTDTDQNKIVV